MTDGPRQRSGTAGSAKDAASEKESGGGVALKKEIGLVSACGIIVGKCHYLCACHMARLISQWTQQPLD